MEGSPRIIKNQIPNKRNLLDRPLPSENKRGRKDYLKRRGLRG